MNYYFFLDGSKIQFSIELFNKPSCDNFNTGSKNNRFYIYAVIN